jgi:site-specific recombinase XerD
MLGGPKMSQSKTYLVEKFLQDLAIEGSSEKTISSYKSDLFLFISWFEQSVDEAFSPHAVTSSDIRDYKSFLLTVQHSKPATINRKLAALKRFFGWAEGKKMIEDSPAEAVKGVASSPRAPQSLEKREIEKLIRAVERYGKKRDLAVVSILRHTGVRVSELCNLTLSDIKLSERKGSLVVRSGKGGRYRDLPLNLDARKAISEYLEVRPAIKSDCLFVNQRRQRLTPKGVQNLITKYARLAGLEDVTPHTLRHSFGKHTLDAGANLVAVSALLGHQRLETTAIYTTPSERDLEQAVDRLVQE